MRFSPSSLGSTLAVLAWLVGAAVATAQEFVPNVIETPFPPDALEVTNFEGRRGPMQDDRYVNDFGGIIEPSGRLALRRLLSDLEEEAEIRVTVLTYPDLTHFGWPDDPNTRAAFAGFVYQAWGIAGENPERPGHLLAIGLEPRHVLYITEEAFRFSWVRDMRNIYLDQLPIDLRDRKFSAHLLETVNEANEIAYANNGPDWATFLPMLGLAIFAWAGWSWVQNLRDEEPPPPPPKQLAPERKFGEPERELTAEDFYEDLHPGHKR
jgi:hypothetical protein